MLGGDPVVLQIQPSSLVTGIQIIASLVTLGLAGIQAYDYLSEEDIYNEFGADSGRGLLGDSSPGASPHLSGHKQPVGLVGRIAADEKAKFLTISLLGFLAISLTAVVDFIGFTYLAVVLLFLLVITEYTERKNSIHLLGDLSFVTRFVLSNVAFVGFLLLVAAIANLPGVGVSSAFLTISFLFLPPAVWFGAAVVFRA